MTAQKYRYYEFGEFRLDTYERLLLKNGRPVPLTFKVFDVLLVLVENHGRILEKEELMQRVWPDAMVEEANLKNSISAIRKALGEAPQASRYIQTLPKRGYRLVAEVVALPDEDETYLVEKHTTAEIVIDQISPGEPTTAAAATSVMDGSPADAAALVPAPDDGAMTLSSPAVTVSATGTERAVRPVMRRKGLAATALVALVLAVAVGAIGLYRWLASSKVSFNNLKITRLTAHGQVTAAAISPDGKYVAYSRKEAGKQSLWLRQVALSFIASPAIRGLPAGRSTR